MSFEQATLVPNEEELLDQEIARTQAELEVVNNRLQRLIQLRRLNEDTEAATQVLDKLASEVAAACGNGYGSRIMKLEMTRVARSRRIATGRHQIETMKSRRNRAIWFRLGVGHQNMRLLGGRLMAAQYTLSDLPTMTSTPRSCPT